MIQLPSVQNYCISKVTSVISKKLKTEVSIKHFSLNINGEISIDEFYLEDQFKDTLLSAGKITIGLDLPDLLQKKINLYKLSLTQVNINVSTPHDSSVWNYQYIIDAFSDSLSKDSIKRDTTGSSYKLSFSNIQLNDIAINFHDRFNKTKIQLDLNKLRANFNESDIDKMKFDIQDISVSGLNTIADIGITTESEDNTTSILPYILLNKIELQNIKIKYSSLQKPVLNVNLEKYTGNKIEADLNFRKVNAGNQELNHSQIAYFTNAEPPAINKSEQKSWNINISNIKLANNTFSMNALNKAPLTSFVSDTMVVTGINLNASNIRYNADTTYLKLKEASFINGQFSMVKFRTQFLMTNTSIEAKDVDLVTTNSSLKGNILLKYPSFETIKNQLQQLTINTEIQSSRISASDIIWFNPKLVKNTIFSNKQNYITISGNVKGKINDLQGNNIHIESGKNTIIHTNINIKGLPDISKANYDIPNFKIISGKSDVEQFIDKKLLTNIKLPSIFQLSGHFKGSMLTFNTLLNLNSSSGAVIIKAKKNKEAYSLQLQTHKLDVGYLLSVPSLGQVTAGAEINGNGLNSNINSRVNLLASEIYFNKYNYTNLSANFILKNKEIQGEASLKDTNIEMAISGLIDLDENNTKYIIKINVKGADLHELHFTESDLSIGIIAEVDLKGNSATTLNGDAGISQVTLAKDGKVHILDTLIFATINEQGKTTSTSPVQC